MTTNTNPGNFANRPTEEVREIAAMGGRASHGSGNTAESEVSDLLAYDMDEKLCIEALAKLLGNYNTIVNHYVMLVMSAGRVASLCESTFAMLDNQQPPLTRNFNYIFTVTLY